MSKLNVLLQYLYRNYRNRKASLNIISFSKSNQIKWKLIWFQQIRYIDDIIIFRFCKKYRFKVSQNEAKRICLDIKFCYAGRNETYALRQLFYRLKMGDVQWTFDEINERIINDVFYFTYFSFYEYHIKG